MEKIITVKNSEGFTLATIIVGWDGENYEVNVLYSSEKTVDLNVKELERGK